MYSDKVDEIKVERKCNMKDIMTVSVVNFKVRPKDKASNLLRICGFAEAAARKGSDLILFPEMCLQGYDCYIDPQYPHEEKLALAETIHGEACAAVSEITKKYGIYVVFGGAEREGDILYNSAFAVGPDGVMGTYRKIHPFDEENTWCAKGDTPFLIDTPWGPVGIGICYDSYQFPELMRYYAAKGARLYLNPTALVEEKNKTGSRQAFLNYYGVLEYVVRCNSIFLASSNLTGYDQVSYFAGASYIIGPKITAFADTDVACYAGGQNNLEAGIYSATLDLSLATRQIFVDNAFSGEPDYRPELYKTW